MPITFVNFGTKGSAASGNITPGLPGDIANDDILICVAHTSDQNAMSMDAAWTQVAQGNGGGTTSRLGVWWHKYAGSDPTRLITHTGGQSPIACIMAFRGVDGTTPIDVAGTIGGGTDASMEHNGVTIATDYAYALAVHGSADDNERSFLADWFVAFNDDSAPAGYNKSFFTTAGTPDGSIGCFIRPMAAGATGTITVTQVASDPWATLLLALRPAASASPIVQAVPVSNTSNSLTWNFSKPPAAGNSIIALLGGFRSGGFSWTAVSDSEGNTFNADVSQAGGNIRAAIYSSHNIAVSGAYAITLDPASTGNEVCGVILEVAGLVPSSTLDRTGSSSGTTTGDNAATASAANTQDDDLVVAVAAFDANDRQCNWGTPSGYTPLGNMPDMVNFTAFHGAFKVTSAGETSSATWTHDNSGQTSRAAAIATYKLAPTIYELVADPGSVAITGTAATLLRSYMVAAESGAVAITGTAADLAYEGFFWSSTEKNARAVLSNDDLTVDSDGSGVHQSGRSTEITEISGTDKKYWEYQIDSGVTSVTDVAVGLVNASMTWADDDYLAVNEHSIGFYNTGDIYWNQNFSWALIGLPFGPGDRVDSAVDFANGNWWVRVNGGDWNNDPSADPAANTGGVNFGIAGSVYPAYSVKNDGGVTVNFGATSFAGTVPAGFSGFTSAGGIFTLDAEPGSVAITGTAAALTRGLQIAAEPGAVSISGTAAGLTRSYVFAADPGAVSITGTAAGLTRSYADLAAEAGAVSISGTAAVLARRFTLQAEAGAVSITGTAAALSVGRLVAADAGAVSITGTAAALQAARLINLDAGSVSIAGTAAALARRFTISAQAGAYSITGTAAALVASRLIGAEPGSVAITGTAAALARRATISAEAGAYAITGTAAALLRRFTIGADAGSYSITGTAAALVASRTIAAEPGTVEITGTDAELETGNAVLHAEPGTVEITGTPAGLLANRTLVAQAGAYSITGTAAGLLRRFPLDAQAGSYAITGTAATLQANRLIGAEPGTIEITGTDAELETGNAVLNAEPGAVSITGTAATLQASRTIAAEPGAVAIEGTAAELEYGRALVAAPGSVSITGADADLARSRVIQAEAGAWTIVGTPAALARGFTLPAESGTIEITGLAAVLALRRAIAAEAGAIIITGIDAELSITTATTDPSRIAHVAPEIRLVAVVAEIRIARVAVELRSVIVPAIVVTAETDAEAERVVIVPPSDNEADAA